MIKKCTGGNDCKEKINCHRYTTSPKFSIGELGNFDIKLENKEKYPFWKCDFFINNITYEKREFNFTHNNEAGWKVMLLIKTWINNKNKCFFKGGINRP